MTKLSGHLSALAAVLSVLVPGHVCAAASPRAAPPAAAKWHPGHYVFVGHQPIGPEHILEHFRGVQRSYAWNALEPEKGRYDFSSIEADVALLEKHHKQLVIQLQYKAFGEDACYVPAYVRGGDYGAGVYRASTGSLDPVIWNPKVGERLDALFAALGRELDSVATVEAIVLPETAPSADLVRSPQKGVDRYTPDLYCEALTQRMGALRRAFPHTAVIQYANFPTGLLPRLAEYMKASGVGLGGPDVYPRPSTLADPNKGVYRLYPGLAGIVPLGAAVQHPDYSVANHQRGSIRRGRGARVQLEPGDDQPIPVREHLKLAREQLKLNYLFWAAAPKYFGNVKELLAAPELANDPAGGLATEYPSRLRRP